MKNRGVKICVVFLLTGLLTISTPLAAQYADHRNQPVDSLEQVLATNPPTAAGELWTIYDALMWGWMPIDPERAQEYANRAIDLTRPIDEWLAVSNSYRVLGLIEYGAARYDVAMEYYDKSLDAAERMREFPKYAPSQVDNARSLIYGSIGNLYNYRGMLHEAVEYYLKALALFEKHGWRESQAMAYYNIGEMYAAMENFPQAEANYLKTREIAHQISDSMFMAYANSGLSIIELEKKDYNRALEYAEAAGTYFFAHPEEASNQVAILILLAGIQMDGYDDVARAEEYIRQALRLIETGEVMVVQHAAALGVMAEIHLRRGEWRAARDAALQSLALDDQEFTNTLPAYEVLVKAYSHLGDAARADEYFDRRDSVQTTWATQHYQSAIRDMEVKYETEKKDTQIATLEDERRLIVWLAVAGGAVLLLVLVALFFIWRWTAQKKRLAEQHIKQLEQEKQLVATQAVLDGEIQERIRLARDLHDGLGSILAAAKYNFADIRKNGHKPLDMERYDTAVGLLDDSMLEMRRVAHHLMPDALGSVGLQQSIADFCSTVPHVKFSWYGDETRLDPNMEVTIYRIMHELVSNALKHSGAEHIIVQVVKESGRFSLIVQDDGCGFDPSTGMQGMGLANIRARVAALSGNLLVDSLPGKGTEIHVELRMENEGTSI